jgi:hypothetical protein
MDGTGAEKHLGRVAATRMKDSAMDAGRVK